MSTRRAQVPLLGKGDNLCPVHKSDVVLSCRDCGGELICLACTTSNHLRHEFVQISEIIFDKKIRIQEYLNRVESIEIPKVKENLKNIDDKIKDNSNNISYVVQQIESQGEKVKAEVDKITRQLIEECRLVEERNFDCLHQHQTILNSCYTQLCENVANYKEVLEKGDNIAIFNTEKDIADDSHEQCNVPKLEVLDFVPRTLTVTKDAIGVLIIQPSGSKSLDKSGSSLSYRANDSKVLFEFKTENLIASVENVAPNSTWMSFWKSKSINLVNENGDVKREVLLDGIVNEISVSSVTGNLWFCCANDHNIYELVGKTPSKRFSTDSYSLCLCVTSDDRVVVGTMNTITVYTSKGKILRRVDVKQLIIYAFNIIESRRTGDIAVCDTDQRVHGGDGKPHVTVLNSKLHLKFKYWGPPSLRNCHIDAASCSPFNAAYDSLGRLLVADIGSNSIQLVNCQGEFLTIIHTDQLVPATLTAIQDGLLFVGFREKIVKVLKYRV